MSLLEAQKFFFDLCAYPETIQKLKKNPDKTLSRFYTSKKEIDFLAKYPMERFETYRNHISMGILGGIDSAFPVVRSLIDEKDWKGLLNEFYLKRMTKSPIARHVFYEFAQFLRKKYNGPLLKRFPYLGELVEYESLDLKLFYAEDKKPAAVLSDQALARCRRPLTLIPVLNPVMAMNHYHYPVHRICRTFSHKNKVKKGDVYLVVYRDPESLQVRFMEVNDNTWKLLRALQKGNFAIAQLPQKLFSAKALASQGEDLTRETVTTLGYLRQKNIVVGYRNP